MLSQSVNTVIPVIDIQNYIEVETLQNGIMELSIYLCLPSSTKSDSRGADTITAGKTDTIIHHSGVTAKEQRWCQTTLRAFADSMDAPSSHFCRQMTVTFISILSLFYFFHYVHDLGLPQFFSGVKVKKTNKQKRDWLVGLRVNEPDTWLVGWFTRKRTRYVIGWLVYA